MNAQASYEQFKDKQLTSKGAGKLSNLLPALKLRSR